MTARKFEYREPTESNPTHLPNEFTITVSVDKVRNLGVKVLKTTDFASPQAEAFLMLYGGALQDKLNLTIKDFVTEKLV
jgi:hypothetical protein